MLLHDGTLYRITKNASGHYKLVRKSDDAELHFISEAERSDFEEVFHCRAGVEAGCSDYSYELDEVAEAELGDRRPTMYDIYEGDYRRY
jgi:hypothetical protein